MAGNWGRKTCDGFPPATRWWEYDPRKVMAAAYWFKRQLPPPFGSQAWRQNWRVVQRQLTERHDNGR